MKTATYINGVLTVTDNRSLDEARTERISIWATECSNTIAAAGIDDITQRNAALGIYGVEKSNQITRFVAACRDEYLRCKSAIMAAETNEEVDAVKYVAPIFEEVPLVTAEQAVSQYFSAYQIAALQELRMALMAAGKPLGPKMTAAKNWLESVMLGWAMNPTPAPQESFGAPSGGVTFEQASAEAVADLQQP